MTVEPNRARIARNEASFRDVNDQLEKGLRHLRYPPELLEFVCECGDSSCSALIELTFEEYEEVRSDSRRFAVAPGHDIPGAERVVERAGRYDVVEKIGEAVRLVEALDKRSPGDR